MTGGDGDPWDDFPSSSSSFSGAGDGGFGEPYLVGFVLANIVGLRYYSGEVSGREMVGLVREPLNPYDPNAIKVLNTRGAQVGHIERSVAAALAPLLDSRLLFAAEAIVPKPPGRNRNPYRLPCQVHLFALPAAAEVVRVAIEEAGLHLVCGDDPEFALSEAAFVKERSGAAGKRGRKKVDELFALVGNAQSCRIAPMEPPPEVIVAALFEHQKEGLGWLVSRENSRELPPFWEEKDGAFVNVLTNYRTNERPPPLRGGIFADDMGLGKTLTLLSLIATNGVGGGNGNAEGKKPRAAKRRKLDGGSGGDTEVSGARTTLVVCPPSVFSSWVTQLEEHTKPRSLKMYLYHGERTRDKEELLKYDIVITTYTTLASEFGQAESPAKEIEWFRVILDEAHVIKNFAAQQTKAVVALKAERRWVVTGTPIQNSSFDLFALMAFLRFQPFSIKSYWQSLVQRPLEQGSKSGLSRLQVSLWRFLLSCELLGTTKCASA